MEELRIFRVNTSRHSVKRNNQTRHCEGKITIAKIKHPRYLKKKKAAKVRHRIKTFVFSSQLASGKYGRHSAALHKTDMRRDHSRKLRPSSFPRKYNTQQIPPISETLLQVADIPRPRICC